MAKYSLGPPKNFENIPKPKPFQKSETEDATEETKDTSAADTPEEAVANFPRPPPVDIPIIRKPIRNTDSFKKIRVSRPSFDPTEGIDFENFASKKEAFLMGYLNALYHRLDGAKRVK